MPTSTPARGACLLLAALLLALACWLRLSAHGPLLQLDASFAENVSKSSAWSSPERIRQLGRVALEWFRTGFLPGLGWLGVVALLSRGGWRAPASPETPRLQSSQGGCASPETPRFVRPEWLLPLLSALLCLGVRLWIWPAPIISDEISYVRQAEYLSLGQLGAQPPAPAAAFLSYNFFEHEASGSLRSIYPPGWPALLALARLMHLQVLLGPVLAGLTTAVVMALAGQMFDRETARIAGALTALSPGFALMAGTYLSHPLSLVLMLTCLYCFLRACTAESFGLWSLACGLSLGWLGLTRYADGALLGLLLPLYLLLLRPRRAWLRALPALAGLALGALALLLSNWLSTGSPWKLAFYQQVYFYAPTWASPPGHLFLAVLGWARLDLWHVPGLLGLAGLAGARGPHRRLLWSALLLYTAYYSVPAAVEVSSRYFYPASALAIILAADAWRRRLPRADWGNAAWTLAALNLAGAVTLAGACAQFQGNARRLEKWLQASLPARHLVFIRSAENNVTMALTSLNSVDFRQRVYPLFLDPESNRRLRDFYSDYPVFVLDFNVSTNNYELHDGNEARDPIQDRLAAAWNWTQASTHYDQAFRLLESLDTAPGSPYRDQIRDLTSRFYMRNRQPEKALVILRQLCREQPGFGRALTLARAEYQSSGRIEAETLQLCRQLARDRGQQEYLQDFLADPWLP